MLRLTKPAKPLLAVMTGLMVSGAVLTGVAAVTVPAHAQANKTIEDRADKAFPLLKNFLALPQGERDKISLVYFLKIKRGSLSQVSITLNENGRTQTLSILPDGRIQPLPSLSQMNNGARISVTGPDGLSPALRLKVVSTLPAGTQYDAGALRAGLEQSNRVSKKVAGVMAGLLPKLDQVFFVGATSATAVMADGSTRPLPATKPNWSYPNGTPVYVPDAMPNVVAIRLNAAPARVIYGDAVK